MFRHPIPRIVATQTELTQISAGCGNTEFGMPLVVWELQKESRGKRRYFL